MASNCRFPFRTDALAVKSINSAGLGQGFHLFYHLKLEDQGEVQGAAYPTHIWGSLCSFP